MAADERLLDFRIIPSIEQLRQRDAVHALEARYGREATVQALRDSTDELRTRLRRGDVSASSSAEATAWVETDLPHRLARALQPSLCRVINATGVIIHTNLGRAPLSRAAIERIAALGTGYTNLEYDLEQGRRGRRDVHAERLLCRLTGAEAAVVVNNNAAAAMLVLASLAAGREVLISRGELVEIGGGFRVPDIMAQSGAVLREVGTTNRTRAADYALALSDRTGLILRVHPSNFRIQGFTERPSLEELVVIGRRFEVPVAEDLGSGNLIDIVRPDTAASLDEPTVRASVGAGADVVFFSGDKILGGPQAGLIVGRRDLLARVRTHPLMRALRVDKMTYAALEATLIEYASGRAADTVPVVRMLTLDRDLLRRRAASLADRLQAGGVGARVAPGVSAVGGGSAPGIALPSDLVQVTIDDVSPSTLEAALRALDTPVVARIENDCLLLDLRTVMPTEDDELAALVIEAIRGVREAPGLEPSARG